MATGDVNSICNRALLSIGSQSQISNLDEGSAQSDACSTLFTPTFEALARTAHWNCLRKQGTLSLVAAAAGTPENLDGSTLPLPPSPWRYAYLQPSDCLQSRFLVPSIPATSSGSPPISQSMISAATCLPRAQIPFIVGYATDANNSPLNVILTNQSGAQLVYTVNAPNPQIWDSLFQATMVASLGAYLVPALVLNMDMMKMQIQIADRLIMQARIRDGDEGTTSQDHIPDWIVSRNAGAAVPGYGACSTYIDMYWGL